MVPKIHKRGTSFKGAAAYLLHDTGRAKTSERVAWVEVKNIAANNPDLAWRIMAATSMDQDRLKNQAGVKATGRKSKDHVMHLSLSWHADEKEGLTRAEMMRAANGALRALSASDRQAIIVSHNDRNQPHVHILINRVSPEDGRILSSSKEKENLSRWAESYEKERGEILCTQRALNNAARARGEFKRGKKNKARHIYELEQKAANDNPDKTVLEKARKEQREKDAAIAKKARETKAHHLKERRELESRRKTTIAGIRAAAGKEIARLKDQTRQEFRPEWEKLFHEHQVSLQQFEKGEETFLGRISNAAKTIDFSE